MNENFVSIKVDREERPDVDRMYMLFVQASTGSGGWPMSVWLTPERKPFFGGTYFPPDNRYGRPGFRAVLERLAEAWRQDRSRVEESGDKVIEQLREYASLARWQGNAGTRSAGSRVPGIPAHVRPATRRLRQSAQVPASQHPQFSGALLRGNRETKKRWRWC